MTLKREYIVFGGLALLFLVVLAYEAFYIPSRQYGHMLDHHNEMHGFMAGQMGPSLLGFNLLFWVLLIILVYVLVKQPSAASTENMALKILEERYVKGDISREEYLEKLKDLNES